MPPRDFLVDPDGFGADPVAVWVSRPKNQKQFNEGLAAWWQHQFALRVREIARGKKLSLTDVGTDAGVGGQLRHLVSGSRPLTLRDMLAVAVTLDDIDAIPPADGSVPLTPPGW